MPAKNPLKLLQQYSILRKTLMSFSWNGKQEEEAAKEKTSTQEPKKAYA